MLQVKSFKFSDDSGINELLKNYRIAQGASIFVSNGEICIPYEDGELPTNAQRIISIKEQKNTMLAQKELIEHSQDVLRVLMEDAKARIDEANANLAEAQGKKGKDKYDGVKVYEQRVQEAQGAYRQLEDQHRQNELELRRLQRNIDIFDERVQELNGNN